MKKMNKNHTVNYAEFYEFCLAWQMGDASVEEFAQLMMPFAEFKAEAYKQRLWVDSMSVLRSN